MKKDEDSNVTNYQKLDKEVSNLSSKISTEFAFLTPLLLSLDEKEIKELKNREELKEFDVYLNKIFRYKAHTLSDKEELVMSTLSSTLRTSANMYYFLTNTDMKFPYLEKWDKELTNTNFVNIQMNEDRELRKEAFENSMTHLINMEIQLHNHIIHILMDLEKSQN